MSAPREDETIPVEAPEAVESTAAAVVDQTDNLSAATPVSVEETPAGAEASATGAAADDDDLDLLGAIAAAEEAQPQQQEAQRVSVSPPRPPSPVRCPTDVLLEDLFGDFVPQDHEPVDPKEWDAETLIHQLFGADMTDMDIFHDFHLETDADDHRISIINKHQLEEDLQPCIDLFGEYALEHLGTDLAAGPLEHPSIATCVAPEDPLRIADRKREHPGTQVWLLEFPKVDPNRQTLHFDSQPFRPASMDKPENTERKFFTPHNVIRWVKSSDGKIVSNARVVKWSDGSATLHVGCDVYELRNSQERNLTILAVKSTFKEENGQERDHVYVEASQFDRHVVAVPAQGCVNTVNEGLVVEKQNLARRARPQESVGMLMGGVPPLRSAKEMVGSGKASAPTPEEEFMNMLREARQKRIEKQKRENNPFSAAQIIKMELDDLELVARATQDSTLDQLLGDMRAAREEAKRQRIQRATTSHAGASSKFARSTALENLDGGGESYEAYNEEGPLYAETQNEDQASLYDNEFTRDDSESRPRGKRGLSEVLEGDDEQDMQLLRRDSAKPVAPEYQ